MAEKIIHRSMNDGSYSWIHDALKEYIAEIEAIGVALYWIITTHAIGKEYVWVSQETYAKELCVTKPTIIKYLKKLENTKPALIRIIKRRKNETDIIHLLKIEPRVVKTFNKGGKNSLPQVVKTFNKGGKNSLPQVVKTFNKGGKNSLPKSYKEKHIKRNKLNETIAKFDKLDDHFIDLISIFNKRCEKLNKSIDLNESKETKLSSFMKLINEGVKKEKIKEIMLYWFKNIILFSKEIREIKSIKDFCENFSQIVREIEFVDDD